MTTARRAKAKKALALGFDLGVVDADARFTSRYDPGFPSLI